VLVSTNGFSYTFNGCNKLTGMPVDLFDYIGASLDNLTDTFKNCSLLVGSFCSLTLNTAITTASSTATKLTGWTASTIANTLKTFSLNNAALTAAAVNQCLADFDATDTATGTLNLAGGTNAAPTTGPPDGVAAKASLVANSWTVKTT
jgi:hypothetical protein